MYNIKYDKCLFKIYFFVFFVLGRYIYIQEMVINNLKKKVGIMNQRENGVYIVFE